MLKKTVSALILLCAMVVGAAAAGSIFPVSRTDIDGVTRRGYLDEAGRTVLSFAYTQAGEFASCGLAAVEDDRWQTGVIDREGHLVVPYVESPVRVDFSEDRIAYRYADHSVYYTFEGRQVGSYAGAQGFFADGLLLCQSPASGLYSYVLENGESAFRGEYTEAGPFCGGRALVRTQEGVYCVIDREGETLFTLDYSVKPVYMMIFEQDTVVLSNGINQALYSLERGEYLTEFLYKEISAFHDGIAMVRQLNRWGTMNAEGRLLIAPTYYYLSYMGEGLYAARSADGSASAVDANGNIAYRTPSYTGGFNELRYGLSWHGTEDGNLIFFRKNGGFYATLKNAENPTLLSENVVRVTQDGRQRYINLATGNLLFEQPVSFDLGQGITAKTVHYERFFGFQQDGSEYGWNVDFPEIDGLPDEQAEDKVNAAIRRFFLEGSPVAAEYQALEGGYGASLEGSVLVVWASCVSGKGAGASVWNDCLAFDVRTGEAYTPQDLFKPRYVETVKSLLPETYPFYLYSFPRMSQKGVTYYYNEYESESRRAYTESYLLPFEQLGDAVDRDSACYRALHTPYVREVSISGFTDVPNGHWAAVFVQSVRQSGLMQGDPSGRFRPNDPVTVAELCATLARRQGLKTPETLLEGVSGWYAADVSAMHAAGLLDGLSPTYDAPITREDAMQVFAHVLVSEGKRLPEADAVRAALAPYTDEAQIMEDRRTAVALCLSEGLVSGYTDGTLQPAGSITRAEFAKLLTTL